MQIIGIIAVQQWSGRPGVQSWSCHAKDSKNGS